MKIDEKLDRLRELMKEHGFAAYIIPTDDFHSSEYVGSYFKAREYMSGFSGSAGTLVVLQDKAALWTDGRYFLQAAEQLKDSTIELMRSGQPDVPKIEEYLHDNLLEKAVIGFDGRTVTKRFIETIQETINEKQVSFDGRKDLVDQIWTDRPPLSKEPVWELEVKYAGKSRAEKIQEVREKMQAEKADQLLVTALDEIAWLFNLRGGDVAYTPVFLSYLLLTKEQIMLFAHKEIFSEQLLEKLTLEGVTIKPYEEIEQAVSSMPAGTKVWLDSGTVNYRLTGSVPEKVEILDQESPIVLMKAVKTPAEMEHMRAAHVKDGVAVTRFIHWLKTGVGGGDVTEVSAAGKLEMFRAQMEGYLEPSFSSIIAYGSHGAIVHYAPTQESDVEMKAESFCLADVGGHYQEGTTDITRTIALGKLSEEEKLYYTTVLRGNLALSAAKFIEGVSGQNLDVLARGPLWEMGMDYNHGTGHGVGFILGVHEGPQRFHWRTASGTKSVPLEEGMIISDEPGLYLEGRFGIRLENLVLCRRGEKNAYGQFLHLEPLTMVPFDREAILPELMSKKELEWLNTYHRKVYNTLSPYLDEEEQGWLREMTARIE
ncbi:MAG: aminopeptidase P family protein [Lachnospiraceae bacterium]|nr:aminopeptidase P family protein [Lachnospiraceae bacterium]